MTETVDMATAARELGLWPGELAFAVQLGEVGTVAGNAGAPRRVSGAELERLKSSGASPDKLRERLRTVGAAEGAEALGVPQTRFARLAAGGCFRPADFYVNRYRAVVWRYLLPELRAFAGRRPELLSGTAPRGLRLVLKEGVDHRPLRWRDRRIEQLSRQAADPWEQAAVEAAVLDASAVARCVPDQDERAVLAALRPDLVTARQRATATESILQRLCLATETDEIFWYQLRLAARLERARTVGPCSASSLHAPGEMRGAGRRGPSRSLVRSAPSEPWRSASAGRPAAVVRPRPGRPAGPATGGAAAARPCPRRWRDRLLRKPATGPREG